ncbi:hypothetical protein NEISICOT_00229 [Neisseria sicca ATCC 29256]|uniref:Uncharacterized protein n=1 Tax=Neisseria sicca ATCC 29256 TaxID=547045 RepID=C6M150_NEISI|nr:hypothetical protein NEISICOT_00229 [Neisseria sicca ATCC 29256]
MVDGVGIGCRTKGRQLPIFLAGISDLRYTFPCLCTLLMRKAAKL